MKDTPETRKELTSILFNALGENLEGEERRRVVVEALAEEIISRLKETETASIYKPVTDEPIFKKVGS